MDQFDLSSRAESVRAKRLASTSAVLGLLALIVVILAPSGPSGAGARQTKLSAAPASLQVVNTPASPPYMAPVSCGPSGCSGSPCLYPGVPGFSGPQDTSQGCEQSLLSDINSARGAEGVGPMELPSNWGGLSVQEQLFVLVNLERTARGLPPFSSMDPVLDSVAQSAAQAGGIDPSINTGSTTLSGGQSVQSWTSDFSGDVPNPLAADYEWMYDDGYGGSNTDCGSPSSPGCWAHRNSILGSYGGTLVMGAGAAFGGSWYTDYTLLLVSSTGQSAAPDFSYSSELPYLAGSIGSPVSSMATTPDRGGYWIASQAGGVYAFGDAKYYGSMGGQPLAQPIVGIASTADGKGYWEIAADGGIFSFGDAKFYGSMGGQPLAQPIVAIASTADGKGYWEVASDGGIFSFGDAKFYGSMGAVPLVKPIVGIASTSDGQGYWLIASDGGVFSFGDAHFFGSLATSTFNSQLQARTATGSGNGYWVTDDVGNVYAFGSARNFGSVS